MSELINRCQWLANVWVASTKTSLYLLQWKASCLARDRHWLTLCLNDHYIVTWLDGTFFSAILQSVLLVVKRSNQALRRGNTALFSWLTAQCTHTTYSHPPTQMLRSCWVSLTTLKENTERRGGLFGLTVCQTAVEEGNDYSHYTHTALCLLILVPTARLLCWNLLTCSLFKQSFEQTWIMKTEQARGEMLLVRWKRKEWAVNWRWTLFSMIRLNVQ